MAKRGLLICAMMIAATEASATTLRVAVRVPNKVAKTFVRRLLGQASDLPIKLVVARTGALERGLAAQIATADRLARRLRCQSVVWLDDKRGARRLLVYVSEVEQQRLFVRSLKMRGDRPDKVPGVTLEAAALAARSALRAQTMGYSLGIDRRRVMRAPRVVTFDDDIGPPPRRTPPPIVRRSRPVALDLSLTAGWQLTLDGQSTAGQHGVALGLNFVLMDWLAFSLFGVVSIPGTIDDPLSEIVLARHSAGVLWGFRWSWGRFRLMTGVQGGIVIYTRSVRNAVASVTPAPDAARLSAAFGPQLVASWQPLTWLHLEISLAGDVLTNALTLTYEQQDRLVEPRHELWRFHPRVGVSLGFNLY